MRTLTFKSTLWNATRLLGLDPVRDLNANLAGRLTDYINNAMQDAWRYAEWPEWILTEQRWFRPKYSASEAVAPTATAPVERYHIASDAYYQALQNSTGQAPATLQADGSYLENSAYWAVCAAQYCANDWAAGTVFGVGLASGLPYQCRNPEDGLYYQCITAHTAGGTFDATMFGVLTAFQKFVDYNQTGQTPIWVAPSVCAFQRDPRVYACNPWPVTTGRNDRGITFAADAPNVIWLKFFSTPPQFTSTLYSAALAYPAGTTIYDAAGTGDCWTSNTTTTPGQSPTSTQGVWTKVPMPFVLNTYLARRAMADALIDQKQTSRATIERARADDDLEEEVDFALAGQGIYESATVATSPSPGMW
jgi:hypothetical protein